MIFFLPFSILFFLFFLVLLVIFLFFFIQIEIVRVALGKLGLPPAVAFLVLICSLLGSGVNIPVYSKEAHMLIPQREMLSFLQPWNMPAIPDKHIIAVNVGGCLIPFLLCIFLLRKAPFLPTLFATLISMIACFKLAKVVPGNGNNASRP